MGVPLRNWRLLGYGDMLSIIRLTVLKRCSILIDFGQGAVQYIMTKGGYLSNSSQASHVYRRLPDSQQTLHLCLVDPVEGEVGEDATDGLGP